jgi:hypothetical protein
MESEKRWKKHIDNITPRRGKMAEIRASARCSAPGLRRCAAMDNALTQWLELYFDEVVNELKRLNSPLYDRLVVRAKELIWQDSIVQAEKEVYCDEYEDEDDE